MPEHVIKLVQQRKRQMKIGVFTVLFSQRSFEEVLDYVKEAGVDAVEIGTGGAPGNSHCDLDRLVEDAAARKQWLDAVTSRGLEISALSCHGNPLHPNKAAAQEAKEDLDDIAQEQRQQKAQLEKEKSRRATPTRARKMSLARGCASALPSVRRASVCG